jgi:5'-nucleotidase / UDP-sugar diphosphatase
MKKLAKISVLLVILLHVATSLFARELSTVQLTLIHINDFHGHLLPCLDRSISETTPVGGAARLAKMIADERANNPDGTLLLAAGDMFQGSPISNVFRGQGVIEVMNYLKFDAMSLGNHEFDWGLGVLSQLAAAAHFPFISANILDNRNDILPFAKPYIIVTRKDLRLAIIGVTTSDTAFITKPDNVSGLTFREPAEVLPPWIGEARNNGANVVVLVSHLGLDADREIAERVSGIDVIVGGHSHTAIVNPLRVNETIIAQAGCYGAYVGVLQLKVDPTTYKVLDYTKENELQTVFSRPTDPIDEHTAGIVERYNTQIKSEFARVIGTSSVDLVRNSQEESNVGDLIGDALREASRADLAFHNSGGIRTDIPKGNITQEQIYTLLPFDNRLVVMDLTGDQIKQILEQSATFEHGILQISGMSVTYDLKKPVGSRLAKALVDNKTLEPRKTYRVATNDFLAAGGDRFTTFKEGKNIVYGDVLTDVFIAYLEKHSPVHHELEKRIVFLKP